MKKFWLVLLGILMLGCNQPPTNYLTIAVASNMQFAMEEIVNAYEKKTAQDCHMVVSSSGKLAAQILEGAPYDILVSADLKYPNKVYEAGLTSMKPIVYGYGKLVLWTTIGGLQPTLENLLLPDIKHIAIANPKIAPYGVAALEVLEHFQMLQSIEDKLVYGESISQTNQFIISGAAEIGFTANSVVLSSQMKNHGQWMEINQNHYAPLAQAAVIINNEKTLESQRFLNFLCSLEGHRILERYGYEVME